MRPIRFDRATVNRLRIVFEYRVVEIDLVAVATFEDVALLLGVLSNRRWRYGDPVAIDVTTGAPASPLAHHRRRSGAGLSRETAIEPGISPAAAGRSSKRSESSNRNLVTYTRNSRQFTYERQRKVVSG